MVVAAGKAPMDELSSDQDDVFDDESVIDFKDIKDRKRRRGVRKYIIEKRRRDRINNSLAELKRLVPAAYEKQGSTKLEKAEILQLTVDHLKTLVRGGIGAPSQNPIEFKVLGFRECAAEVSRYLTSVEGLDPNDPLRMRLLSHLACCQAQCPPEADGWTPPMSVQQASMMPFPMSHSPIESFPGQPSPFTVGPPSAPQGPTAVHLNQSPPVTSLTLPPQQIMPTVVVSSASLKQDDGALLNLDQMPKFQELPPFFAYQQYDYHNNNVMGGSGQGGAAVPMLPMSMNGAAAPAAFGGPFHSFQQELMDLNMNTYMPPVAGAPGAVGGGPGSAQGGLRLHSSQAASVAVPSAGLVANAAAVGHSNDFYQPRLLPPQPQPVPTSNAPNSHTLSPTRW